MNILILGGTSFLGLHLTEAILNKGHKVTLFNRGITNPSLFHMAEHLKGNRDGDMYALENRTWDAVVDTSGYLPRVVKQGLLLLSGKTEHYIFISSISVYPDVVGDFDEDTETVKLNNPYTEEIIGETYGGLKALCEQAVLNALSEKATIVRPGLIVGPHDPTDRFTYWPHRIEKGGTILAPGNCERLVQFIDVRDLADWLLLIMEKQVKGIFNATGPLDQLSMGQLLESCTATLNPKAKLVWINDDFLLKNKLTPWSDLPLWIPDSKDGSPGFMQCNCKRAIEQGLHFRPIKKTIADTQKWNTTRTAAHKWKAGISKERERQILELWESV